MTMLIIEMTTIPAITDAGAIIQGNSVANFAIDCISNISCQPHFNVSQNHKIILSEDLSSNRANHAVWLNVN
jgi:hypothetical protein